MKISQHSQKLLFLFKDLFQTFESGAVLLPDGTALHVKYSNLADIGTFELAGRTTQQYLQLKPGQIAMTNDPYSGGTILSTVTLLMGVALSDKTPEKTDLILCYRFLLRPAIYFATSIDEEGLRIPPTPIIDKGSINQELLQTMAAHPLCPDEILPKTIQGVERLRIIQKDLLKGLQIYEIGITKATIQEYLSDSREIMHSALAELPFGDLEAVHHLSDGKIKMNLEIKSNSTIFDFKDTTSSKLFAITEAGTFGACFGALLAFYEDRMIPVNAGTFNLIQVVSPSRSLLSAKYPMSTFVGMTEGLSLTANLVLKTLLKLVPTKKVSLGFPGQCSIDIQFESGPHFFDTIPGGTGASSQRRGEDGVFFWGRSSLQSSVEDIESRFPLRISSITTRASSGGRGLNKGGEGIIKTYEILSTASVRWLLGVDVNSENANEHSSTGAPPEISFTSKTGQKTEGATKGEIKLNAGDRVTIMSGGGNGFGTAKASVVKTE